MKYFLLCFVLLHGISTSAQDFPEPHIYAQSFYSMKGFIKLTVDTYLNEKASECAIQEKSLLTKALVKLSNSAIEIEESGSDADGIVMIAVETEVSSEKICLSILKLKMMSFAAATFLNTGISQTTLVTLFDRDKVVYSDKLNHYQAVDDALTPMLDEFLYNWNYFNTTETP